MNAIFAWLRQPTSVAGISGLIGTAVAACMGEMTWSHAIPLLASSVIAIAIPDNAGAARDTENLARLVVSRMQTSAGTAD